MYDWISGMISIFITPVLIKLAVSSLGLMLRILRSLESLLEPANGLNL
jgi:hypothetical protein